VHSSAWDGSGRFGKSFIPARLISCGDDRGPGKGSAPLRATSRVSTAPQPVKLERRSGTNPFRCFAPERLGAALAALAAKFADELPDGRAPQAVYVYGMPRAGGERFRDAYNARLGPITYRFVHGEDIVARVPMSQLVGGIDLGYRHVGRALACASGGKFNAAAMSATVTDDPQFAQGLVDTFVGGVAGVLAGHLFSPPGPGTFGPLFKFLPQPIRDHLQDQYYKALAA
jgi:hypothetical protein